MGENISKTILANNDERNRRSNNMKKLNETVFKEDYVKKIISETAKATSARPEIIQKRTDRLAKWRNENPEDFKNKCVLNLINNTPTKPSWFSKPEKHLFEILSSIDGFDFKFNQVIKSKIFDWSSKRKQIDIMDKTNKIVVEYDGPWHFKQINDEEKFKTTQHRDAKLEEFISLNNDYILIRISYDQFVDRKTLFFFKEECLDIVRDILINKQPGIYKIGKYYGKY